jgi:hypothetical protein
VIASAASHSAWACQRSLCSRMSSRCPRMSFSAALRSESRCSRREARTLASTRAASPPDTARSPVPSRHVRFAHIASEPSHRSESTRCVAAAKASAARIRAIAGAVIGTGRPLGAGGKSRPVVSAAGRGAGRTLRRMSGQLLRVRICGFTYTLSRFSCSGRSLATFFFVRTLGSPESSPPR